MKTSYSLNETEGCLNRTREYRVKELTCDEIEEPLFKRN